MADTFRIDHHFLGEGSLSAAGDESGSQFIQAITGSGPPTVGYVSAVDAVGVLQAALSADSEVQNACAYSGDVLGYDIERLKSVEFRARLSTALGTTATTMVAFGLTSARNDAIDSITEALLFRVLGDGSGAVLVESDDGTNDNNDVATGETLATTWKRFVIDFTQGLSDVRFYMDGGYGLKRVAESTTFSVANYTAGLQFFAQIQKAANTNVGTLQIDRFSVEFKEL
ncbi:hypothetical protein Pan216_20940 [Planctomycetes bacterium Pan216]|uniref:Uncharacterized protein n=1 Tax=Kolteria novifilia TaxID=2527975 RepID=A0A518B2M8_9BACT|nr:hypothetical protein Pan216_20940 [Planctomycetes bacterium Pan216]